MSEFKYDIAALSIPLDFNYKIGDTGTITHKGQPLEVTWQDKDHLNIGGEVRTIRSVKTYKRYKIVEFHLVY